LLAWNPLYRWPWLWFLLAFATLLGAWTVFIIIATRHPVALVPLNMPPPAAGANIH
jgi:hypothetical protein